MIYYLLCNRNQRHGNFQDESSIFLDLHGLTSTGMSAGMTLGFARNPKTTTKKKHEISLSHTKNVEDRFKQLMVKKVGTFFVTKLY